MSSDLLNECNDVHSNFVKKNIWHIWKKICRNKGSNLQCQAVKAIVCVLDAKARLVHLKIPK